MFKSIENRFSETTEWRLTLNLPTHIFRGESHYSPQQSNLTYVNFGKLRAFHTKLTKHYLLAIMHSTNNKLLDSRIKPCILCHSQSRKRLYTCSFDVDVYMCGNCGFLFAGSDRSARDHRSVFNHHYASRLGELEQVWNLDFRRTRAQRRIDFLNRWTAFTDTPKVLEIGSFTGHFLRLAKKFGWQIEGLEPDKHASAFLRRKLGIPIHTCVVEVYLEDCHEKFDMVCLFHVLEHLIDPIEVLQGIRKLIDDGGVLCLEVPNGTACGNGDWGKFFNADETHLWYFSKRTLEITLNKAGFEMKKLEIVPAHSGPTGALLALAKPVDKWEINDTPRWKPGHEIVKVTYRRIRWARFNWLLWRGPYQRFHRISRYAIWYLLKGWRKRYDSGNEVNH